jgi:hypothetical protein
MKICIESEPINKADFKFKQRLDQSSYGIKAVDTDILHQPSDVNKILTHTED